ncbi:ribosomal protein, L30 [Nesidiocoris tenuis]|uniref:Ribosomal protein, L30 n=1 Tax=Nesidiocoris tenuis TaxID=355587 RepID=A0ABN7AMI1_9HEMI|nr:ribosomal protein, L30 [Nesidiocoris tenuis]
MQSLKSHLVQANAFYGFSSHLFRNGIKYGARKSWTGAIEYDGFKFFPRHPDHKDPPVEATKLFMVQRIGPFKGNEWRLKKILEKYDLHGKPGEVAIVRNTTKTNEDLYKIKHLIKVTPIRTPNGVPDEGDLGAGYLREDGTFIYSKKLIPDPQRLRLAEDFKTEPSRLDSPTLIKESRDRWLNPWQ